MKVLRDAVLVEDHQRNARRAMERVFRRIEKRSLDHGDPAGTENAPRFESNASLGVGIDLVGKVRTAHRRHPCSADEVKVLREMAEEAVALAVPIETIEHLKIEALVFV